MHIFLYIWYRDLSPEGEPSTEDGSSQLNLSGNILTDTPRGVCFRDDSKSSQVKVRGEQPWGVFPVDSF